MVDKISPELIIEQAAKLKSRLFNESTAQEIYLFFNNPLVDSDELTKESFERLTIPQFNCLLNADFRELFLKEVGDPTRMTWILFLQLGKSNIPFSVGHFMACLHDQEEAVGRLLASKKFTMENFIFLWNLLYRGIYFSPRNINYFEETRQQTFLQKNADNIIKFLEENNIESLSNAAWQCMFPTFTRFLPAPLGDNTLSMDDWLTIPPDTVNMFYAGLSPFFTEFKGQLFLLAQLCYSRQPDRKDSQMHAEIITRFLKEHQEQGASVAGLMQIVKIVRDAYHKIFQNIRLSRPDDPDFDFPIPRLNELELKLLYTHFNHPQVSNVISGLRLPASDRDERSHLLAHLLEYPENIDRIDAIRQLSPRSKQAFFQRASEREVSALSSAPAHT